MLFWRSFMRLHTFMHEKHQNVNINETTLSSRQPGPLSLSDRKHLPGWNRELRGLVEIRLFGCNHVEVLQLPIADKSGNMSFPLNCFICLRDARMEGAFCDVMAPMNHWLMEWVLGGAYRPQRHVFLFFIIYLKWRRFPSFFKNTFNVYFNGESHQRK